MHLNNVYRPPLCKAESVSHLIMWWEDITHMCDTPSFSLTSSSKCLPSIISTLPNIFSIQTRSNAQVTNGLTMAQTLHCVCTCIFPCVFFCMTHGISWYFKFLAVCLLKKSHRVSAAMRQEAKGGGGADECNNQCQPVQWGAAECNNGGHFGGRTERKEGKLVGGVLTPGQVRDHKWALQDMIFVKHQPQWWLLPNALQIETLLLKCEPKGYFESMTWGGGAILADHHSSDTTEQALYHSSPTFPLRVIMVGPKRASYDVWSGIGSKFH